ncbi:hypothetical protein P43SY_006521 [Pythium insidiosum]|uniref:Uncharacterized protein n=1 Tax=Pythium insidiosum TaxID=114742 RepID=A0AAD5M3X4_PYTIN|nr:hypothetical protein P43SY_006521 [Pythium insidiosum]
MSSILPTSTTEWVRQLQQFQQLQLFRRGESADFDMLEMMSSDGISGINGINRTAWVISWENVLVPTEWMAQRVGLAPTLQGVEQARQCCASIPTLRDSMIKVENQILELLVLAANAGPVYILTDETVAFVEAMCEAFFPRLLSALYNCGGRVKVIGVPDKNMSVAEKATWKVDAFQNICCESTPLEMLMRQETGDFRLITVSADELDVLASSAVKDIAPFAVVKAVQMPIAQNGSLTSLDSFHNQLQGLIGAVHEELEMDKLSSFPDSPSFPPALVSFPMVAFLNPMAVPSGPLFSLPALLSQQLSAPQLPMLLSSLPSPSAQHQAFVVHLENVLVPTKWMSDRLGLSKSALGLETAQQQYQLSPDLQVALRAIEDAALQLLRVAASMGPVFVVSDNTLTYLEVFCSVFFPTLTAFFRDANSGVHVLGAPAANLPMSSRVLWKTSALRSICLERLYSGPLASALLAHPHTGRFSLVTLLGSDVDSVATSKLAEVAPHAVLKTAKVAASSFGSPMKLEEFHAQLQTLVRFLLEATKHDSAVAVTL